MIAQRADSILFQRSDPPALTKTCEARCHQVEASLATGNNETSARVVAQKVIQVLHKGAAERVIVDFIQTIHEEEDMTAFEKRQRASRKPVKSGRPVMAGRLSSRVRMGL